MKRACTINYRLIALAIAFIVAGWPCLSYGTPRITPPPKVAHNEGAPRNVVCQPLFVCDIVFDPGETILNMATGDSVRWILNTAASGDNGDIPHVLVKPTDYGLRTNLIITTSKRVCYLILVSTTHNYQYRTHFYYPIDDVAHIKPNVHADSATVRVNSENLDFAYRIHGERSFIPVHVMNDGTHTYIEMPQGLQDMPVLYVMGNDGSDMIVNYRFRSRSFVLDGVPQRMALVQGSGRGQRRVIIERGN